MHQDHRPTSLKKIKWLVHGCVTINCFQRNDKNWIDVSNSLWIFIILQSSRVMINLASVSDTCCIDSFEDDQFVLNSFSDYLWRQSAARKTGKTLQGPYYRRGHSGTKDITRIGCLFEI